MTGMVITQDLAVTAFAVAGALILARRFTRAFRPKTAAKCEHCPSGAAVYAKAVEEADRSRPEHPSNN
jgi:hypothetical protein